MSDRLDITKEFPELLIPFEASFIPGSKVVFSNGKHKEEQEIIRDYSFVVDEGGAGSKMVFFAERYGGSGILNNGGGGRCGIGSAFQVKGIGPTPMVGRGTRLAHADGKLSINGAIYETLWALLANSFLPYGAIGTQYIIKLSTTDPADRGRALLLRNQHLRLAHFQRALYFRSNLSGAADATRVQIAVQKIKDYLPVRHDEQNLHPAKRITLGLGELVRRNIYQCAALKVRRLIHLASPSNISISGQLLDFGTINVLKPSEEESKAWDAELYRFDGRIVTGAIDTAFYCEKYLEGCVGLAEQVTGYVSQIYRSYTPEAMGEAFLMMLGFPKLEGSGHFNEMKNLSRLIQELLRIERQRQFHKPSAPEEIQLSALGALLLELCNFAACEAIGNYIHLCQRFTTLENARKLAPYCAGLNQAIQYLSAERKIPIAHLALYFRINITRVFSSRNEFSQETLDLEMSSLAQVGTFDSAEGVEEFIEKKYKRGLCIFASASLERVLVWSANGRDIEYSSTSGKFTVSTDSSSTMYSIKEIMTVATCELDDFKKFYHQAFKGKL